MQHIAEKSPTSIKISIWSPINIVDCILGIYIVYSYIFEIIENVFYDPIKIHTLYSNHFYFNFSIGKVFNL